MESRIERFLADRSREGLLRKMQKVSPLAGNTIEINGKNFTNFSSNDYLGLASHPLLLKVLKEDFIVTSTSASRLMSGNFGLHEELEKRVSEFKFKEDSLIFNSGYQANVGAISALFNKNDVVFSDRLNHASIIDGILLSGAKLVRFNHNDMAHLEDLLKKERNKYKEALIATESVFSMDGDIAPLREIVRLKKENDCMLMVDEAHATGVFGEAASGVAERDGVTEDVDILMGTFGKALGGFGAYIATSKIIKEYLVNTARSFIYSTSLPPVVIMTNLAALELVKKEPFRRTELVENSDFLRNALKGSGFDAKGASQIVPIITGDVDKTVALSEYLREEGFWAMAVRPPTVPQGASRIRLSLCYGHTRPVLEKFLDTIRKF